MARKRPGPKWDQLTEAQKVLFDQIFRTIREAKIKAKLRLAEKETPR
ncbi:MAG: hypothetical protein RBR35_14610 [Salinivirgaceae bacterium]|nr:hypothetical protein [Geobacteraceae bacterium]MDY0281780.1 hypothetical protein [Salinivirgaceae bacterium]